MRMNDWKSFLIFGCLNISSSRKSGLAIFEQGGRVCEKKKSETTSYCFFSSLVVVG
jgi:hypothetical protein